MNQYDGFKNEIINQQEESDISGQQIHFENVLHS